MKQHMAGTRMQPFELNSYDGITLHGRVWEPAPGTSVRGLVQLVHGMGEHGLRYGALAAHLTAAGYVVAGHDNRAHGLTAGGARGLGLMPPDCGWARWIEDIMLVADHCAGQWPELPHVLLGHSLGSLLSQHVAALHGQRFAGVVLSATDNRPGRLTDMHQLLAPALRRLSKPHSRNALLHWIGVGHMRSSIRNRRTDADWLSRDPSSVDAYLADPLCNFIPSTAMWLAIVDGMGRISGDLRGRLPTDIPLLLLVGTADPLSEGGKRVHALARAYQDRGATRVTLLEYQDARHELFNEINREQVLNDLLGWLNSSVAAAAPDQTMGGSGHSSSVSRA